MIQIKIGVSLSLCGAWPDRAEESTIPATGPFARRSWDELTDAQYLRVYVRQLRQKIEVDPERPQFVLTETGIGYRLGAPG